MRIEYSWDRGQSDCAHGSVTATYSAALLFLAKFDWPRDFGSSWHSFNGWIMQPDPLSGLDVIMIIIINGPLAALIGQNMKIRTFPLKCKYGRRTLITIHWSLADDMRSVCDITGHVSCVSGTKIKLFYVPGNSVFCFVLCDPCSGTVLRERKRLYAIFSEVGALKQHFCSIDMCSQISTGSADMARSRIMISITHKVFVHSTVNCQELFMTKLIVLFSLYSLIHL